MSRTATQYVRRRVICWGVSESSETLPYTQTSESATESMSCQIELGEHVIQQSLRRPDLRLRLRRLSPTNNPQNRLLQIPSVLSPILQTTKAQVMSFFNLYVISARACTKLAFFFLIDTFHSFLLVIADDAHYRVRRSPNVPQPQSLLHPPMLL